MPQPPANCFNYDIADSIDPRVGAGYVGQKGTIFRYVPDVGPALTLQKQDNGKTTNWTVVGGGGGTPVGNPHDVAFYDGVTGNLTFQDTFQFLQTPNHLVLATLIAGGTLTTTATNSFTFGLISGAGSTLANVGVSNLVFGQASAGTIQTSGAARGSLVFGRAVTGATIQSTSTGSLVFGAPAQNTIVEAVGGSCLVFGSGVSNSSIIGNSQGSITFGFAVNGTITSNGSTSCFAGGFANSGSISASGNASFAFGITNNDNLIALGDASVAFGQGNSAGAFLSFTAGRFCNVGGDPNNWIANEILFALGNGANSGSLNNAFQIDKDGKQLTTAATKNTAVRAAVNPDTLSERTDRSLFVDTSVGAVAFVVNMPPGEAGLEYFVKDIGNNAAANNITFTPNGADVMEPGSNITTNAGFRHFQFFNGTWWSI